MSLRFAGFGEDSLVAWRGSGTGTEVFSFCSYENHQSKPKLHNII